ncbi:hypothetical protein M9458_055902, partial [Cirrhinus mrigala]
LHWGRQEQSESGRPPTAQWSEARPVVVCVGSLCASCAKTSNFFAQRGKAALRRARRDPKPGRAQTNTASAPLAPVGDSRASRVLFRPQQPASTACVG